MPLDLVTIPCLRDNYAFLIGNPDTGEAAIVDVPEAGPINAAIAAAGWRLTTVLLTHHHDDHIMGLPQLEAAGLHVIGATADAHRLPPLNTTVADGDTFSVLGHEVHVFDVSGHTVGHIAFYIPDAGFAFTGDSLMATGCGRLFEGTPAQMWTSLKKLRALPPETTICSGHEYTLSNTRFAMSLEPDEPRVNSLLTAVQNARDQGKATVPSSLQHEKQNNPFLRADDPALMAAVGMADAEPVDVFAEIRRRKDSF